MTLIFDDVSRYRRYFHYLMALRISDHFRIFKLIRHPLPTVTTLCRQNDVRFSHLLGWNKCPMMPGMPRLPARLTLASWFATPSLPRLASKAVRRRWFGGVSRVLFVRSQLSFKLGDLLALLIELFVLLGSMLDFFG